MNRSRVFPIGTEALTEAAWISDPDAIVWRDVSLPLQERGVKVLKTPMGSPEFVRSTLAAVSAKHDRLMSQIVGIAWILLLYCAAARLNYMLRVVHPTLSLLVITMRLCVRPSVNSWRRHPSVAVHILQELSHPHVAGFHLAAAQTAREELVRDGFVAPAWESLAEGLRPMLLDPEDQQLGMPGHGWHHQQQTPCTRTSSRRSSVHV